MLSKLGLQSARTLLNHCRGIISSRSILVSGRQTFIFQNAELLLNFSRDFCKKVDASSPRTSSRAIQSSTIAEVKENLDHVEEVAGSSEVESVKTTSSKLEKRTSTSTYFADNVSSNENTSISSREETIIENTASSKSDLIADPNPAILKSGVHDLVQNYPNVSRFQLASNWRKKYLGTQGIKFPGKVFVIKSIQDELAYMDVLEGFLKEAVLGFDTEHCPVQHLVCVVQLATHDRAVLWQCLNFKKRMPYFLREILVGDITKVGHACMDDAIMISKQFKEEPQNLIDTNCWARDLHCSPQSLQGLCAIFLGEHLSKTHQQSNWKKDQLSPGQIRYAATDAWISLKVYEEMKRHAEELDVPLTPMYKTLQERYQEVTNSRRLKRRRRRQRIKEKKQEMKAKALQQTTDSTAQELNINAQETTSSEMISNSTNESSASKVVVQGHINSTSNSNVVSNSTNENSFSKDVAQGHVSPTSSNSNVISKSTNENSLSKDVSQMDVRTKIDSDQDVNEFVNTVDPTAVSECQEDSKIANKKSIGSRQRHKRFLLKFHPLE